MLAVVFVVGAVSAQTQNMGTSVVDSSTPYLDLGGAGSADDNPGINWELKFDPNEGGTIATDGVALIHYLGSGYNYGDENILVIPSINHPEANYVQYSYDVVGDYGPVEVGDAFGVYDPEGSPMYAALVVTVVGDGMIGFTWKRDFGMPAWVVDSGPFSGYEGGGGDEDFVFGSATIHIGETFDISTGMINPAMSDADFGFVSNEGVNLGNEGWGEIPGPMFLKLNFENYDPIVPEYTGEAPWISVTYDFEYGTLGQPLSVGDLFAVYTREGYYGGIIITGLPDGDFGNAVSFDYAYNTTGANVLPSGGDGDELVYGVATLSQYQSFDLSTATVDPPTADADFGFVMNEGAHFGNEGWPDIPGPMFLKLQNGIPLQGIESVPEYTGDAPWISVTYDFMYGSLGAAPRIGDTYVVYTREGHYGVIQITGLPEGDFGSIVQFAYVYNPSGSNVFSGGGVEPGYWIGGIHLYDMGEHIGKMLYLRVYNESTQEEIIREVVPVMESSGLLGGDQPIFQDGESYVIDFFVDVNENGAYDAPPTDYAWRISTGPVYEDTIVDFYHTMDFTDIAWPHSLSFVVAGQGRINNSDDFGFFDHYGSIFSFLFGMSANGTDTSFQDIQLQPKYGPGLGSVNTFPNYGFVYLLGGEGLSLDDVESVPEYTGENYYRTTYESDGPRPNMPVAVGDVWAIYGHKQYAATKITEASINGSYAEVAFDYIVQPNGSTDLSGERIEPLGIQWMNPDVNAFNVPQNFTLQLQFTENIDVQSLYEFGANFEMWGETTGDLQPTVWFDMGEFGRSSLLVADPDIAPGLGERVFVRVSTDLRSTSGRRLIDDFETSFMVSFEAPPFMVEFTWPDEWTWDLEIGPRDGIIVGFNDPVDMATVVAANITVYNETAAQEVTELTFNLYNDWDVNIEHPEFGLGDSITVTVGTGVQSVGGTPLSEPYVFGYRVRETNPVIVDIPDASINAGASIRVPIYVENVVGKEITSFQMRLSYDMSSIRLDSVSLVETIIREYWPDAELTTNPFPAEGYVFVSGAASVGSPLGADGVLLYLHFTGLQNHGSWVDVSPVDGYMFNEGEEPIMVDGGYIEYAESGTVGGRVVYAESGVPVANVHIIVEENDAVVADAFTNAQGEYTFTNVEPGLYRVTFDMANVTGVQDAISPMDASYILQNVVMIREFSSLQDAAGDVTDNGDVTAFDASHVLGYTVGNIAGFAKGTWLVDTGGPDYNIIDVYFEGGSAYFESEAIVVGDVSANWSQTAPALKPGSGSTRVATLAQVDGTSLQLNLDRGVPVYGASLVITTNEPAEISEVTSAEGWINAWRVDGNEVIVALAGGTPIEESIDLMTLRFVGQNVPRIEHVDISLNDGMIATDVVLAIPTKVALHPAAPNPFNPSTQIRYELPSHSPVNLVVYNSLGQHIRTLVSTAQVPGIYRVEWNGRDETGREVASGAYMVVLRTGEKTLSQRIMLVR